MSNVIFTYPFIDVLVGVWVSPSMTVFPSLDSTILLESMFDLRLRFLSLSGSSSCKARQGKVVVVEVAGSGSTYQLRVENIQFLPEISGLVLQPLNNHLQVLLLVQLGLQEGVPFYRDVQPALEVLQTGQCAPLSSLQVVVLLLKFPDVSKREI